MKITIDDRILSKYDLTIEELLVLMLSKEHADIPQIVKSLLDKDIGVEHPKDSNIVLLRQKEDSLLKDIFLESNNNIINKADRYELLAAQLRNLYPTGKKEGTSYMWRDLDLDFFQSFPLSLKKLIMMAKQKNLLNYYLI